MSLCNTITPSLTEFKTKLALRPCRLALPSKDRSLNYHFLFFCSNYFCLLAQSPDLGQTLTLEMAFRFVCTSLKVVAVTSVAAAGYSFYQDGRLHTKPTPTSPPLPHATAKQFPVSATWVAEVLKVRSGK
jgi:hypothetical protein